MQEILFRGKPKSNNEYYCFSRIWKDNCKNGFVYGSLIVQSDKYFICVSTVGVKMNCCINNSTVSMIEVIPETVGQYTGLTDKNDKKIFKGDIVKTQPFYDKPYSDKRKSKEFIGVVKYKTKIFKGNKYYSKQCFHGEWGLEFYEDFGKYTHYSWGELWNCEVIGNIHDNPELLKEAEQK